MPLLVKSFEKSKLMDNLVPNIWQAFPAGSGPMDRTTYMFTYVDPQPGCPKLEELLEDYWNLMPNYQVAIMVSIYHLVNLERPCQHTSTN